MTRCEHYEALMLEHLYGLLEREDSQDLSRHLSQCPSCRQALAKAEGQQHLLTEAARCPFPQVRFEAPARQDYADTLPVGGSRRGWFRWAVAATILVAMVGLGVPGGLYSQQRDRVALAELHLEQSRREAQRLNAEHQKLLDQAKTGRTAAQKELEDIQRELQNLERERNQAVQNVWTETNNHRFRLSVSGPKTPEPGAPNAYTIETRTLANQPAPAKLSVKVRDGKQQVVFEKEVPTKGQYRLALPNDLPLKPNSELTFEVTARTDAGKTEELSEKLELIAPAYLTHLTTDKPMYQPGEVVHFRSLTLERSSLRPVEEDLHLIYVLTKPSGEKVQIGDGSSRLVNEHLVPFKGPDGQPVRGIGCGEFQLQDAVGGEYTLSVRDSQNRFPEQNRKFLVNVYEKPRLNKELKFARAFYGAGETITVRASAMRAEEKKPVADQKVTAEAKVDNLTIQPVVPNLRTDSTGSVEIRFKLPAKIERGSASVSVNFTDGGSNESIVRPIPLVLGKLEVEYFPEGGDLVAGVPNRVYFQVRSTLGKPAELKGRLLDENDAVVTDVATFNDPKQPNANHGMGAFAFTPLEGKKYRLKVDEPLGIDEIVKPGNQKDGQMLPAVKADGVVLSVPTGVTRGQEPIHVQVRSARSDRKLLVGAYCRGRLMDHRRVAVVAGQAVELDLRPDSDIGGVFRVTVFEERAGAVETNLIPVAERLVYRMPGQKLNLSVQPERQTYVPGERVKLICLAADEKGHKAPAILLVAVVDKSVLTLADEKTFRQMPTHFLLTTEVRRPEDLEYADFLVGEQATAGVALDLLLGTQGWRRFAEQDPGKFRRDNPRDADQVLVMNNHFSIDNNQMARKKAATVYSSFAPRFGALGERAARTAVKLEVPVQDKALRSERGELSERIASFENERSQAVQAVNASMASFDKVRRIALPALALAALLAGIVALARGLMMQRRDMLMPYLAGSLACLAIGVAAVALPIGPGNTPVVAQAFSVEMPAWGSDDQLAHAERRAENELRPADEAAALAADRDNDDKKPNAKRLEGKGVGKGGDKAGGGGQARVLQDAAKQAEKLKFDGLNRNGVMPLNAPAPGRGAMMPFAAKPAAPRLAGAFKNQGAMQKAVREPAEQQMFQRGLAERKQPDLRRRGDFRFAGPRFGKDARMEQDGIVAAIPFVVREFSHQHAPAEGNKRTDFAETIYWHPVLVLPDGKAEVEFDLSDSLTTFQVLAAGHTLDGRLGAVTCDIESRKPLSVEPKLPTEVTAGDRIDLPVTVANGTNAPRTVNVRLKTEGLKLEAGKADTALALPADSRKRALWQLRPTLTDGGQATVSVAGTSPGVDSDTKEVKLKVVPEGFPIVGSRSDMLEQVARNVVALPADMLPGSLHCQVTVYPSTLADLQKGLEALLREPNGCFEQTSTTNYPNLLVLNYLKETDQGKKNPTVVQRAEQLLARGYAKLTSFECLDTRQNNRQGYEWFGGTAPPHEALTAYGLMQFRDMAQVYDVDRKMVDRTRNYLMSRRDGKGGFLRNGRALDTFGRAPQDITDAYIVWSLTEGSKDDDVTKELDAIALKAKDSKDPYFLALVANSLLNRGKNAEAVDVMKQLAKDQKDDGHLDAQQTSITGSGGRDLQIETTALTLLAWLKSQRPEFTPSVQKAVKWLGQQRGGHGGFGSTQATILALKALITHAKANKKTPEAGELLLFVADKCIAKKTFAAGASEAIVLDVADAEKLLKAGNNDVRVEITGKNVFPYTLTWSYRTRTPLSADKCFVRLQTRLDKTKVQEGDAVRLTASIENVSGKGQGMALAVIGLPAGLTIPEDMAQLKDMAKLRNNGTERGQIDFFEIRGRELVLYWRDLAPGKKVEVSLDLMARVPGVYRGPASRGYLYYNADAKNWIDPLQVTIAPK